MKRTFLFFLLILTFPLKAQEKVLTVASDEWCPYICHDNDSPGFLVELLKEIALKNNISLSFSFIPLSRALKLANTSAIDIVLALTTDHFTSINLQKSQQHFGVMFNDFYVNSDNDWKYNNVNDLDSFLQNENSIGIISGYEYGDTISQKLEKHKSNVYKATGDSPLANLIKMLNSNRLNAFLDSRFTVQYQLKESQDYNITYAGTEGDAIPLFLGFSPSIETSIIKTFDDGLLEMRNNGRLTEILSKYHAKDWEKELSSQVQ